MHLFLPLGFGGGILGLKKQTKKKASSWKELGEVVMHMIDTSAVYK